MRNRIYSYAIMAEKKYKQGEYYFMFGFKTLPTMHKRFNDIKHFISLNPGVKHDRIILCSRDYEGNILKIYEEV